MKRLLVIVFGVIVLIGLGAASAPAESRAAPPPAVGHFQQSEIDEAVKTAFQNALQGSQPQVLGFLIYTVEVDRIEYSQDSTVALMYLALKDPLTGNPIDAEPGLSIAVNSQNANPTEASSWQIKLQNSADFTAQIQALPPELLSEDLQMRFLTPAQQPDPQNSLPVFTGYKLPWAAGVEKRLSGSIGHVLTYRSCPETCRYAYDWADGTMFPLLASKGGTVKSFRTGCANNDHSCTNFLVLEDQSTIPTTYQVYYHMAFNSLPERLRVVGTPVRQGEYIGDVDNTGYSTGHHLHFHVFVATTRSNWEWGYSVDFTYDDVPINGGHPRTCAEARDYPSYGSECMVGKDGKRGGSDDDRFVSGNTPAHPPSGALITPVNRQVINSQFVTVGGTASDDIQVTRIQVLATWSGLEEKEKVKWKTIDNITPGDGGIFTKAVDLCAANVPEGPFALKVKVYDREGSQVEATPGTIQLIKNFACGGVQVPPAPACAPGDNQVALYSEPDFRGTCRKFDAGDHAYSTEDFGALGDNNASSVQVGRNVLAILYDLRDDLGVSVPEGRIETLDVSDVNLADNRIGSDRVSGLLVLPRSTPPDEPFLPVGSPRLDGTAVTSQDSVVLAWSGGAGGTAFDVILSGAGKTDTWTVTRASSVSVGALAPGDYTWVVTATNGAGSNTSNIGSFTVGAAAPLGGTARTLPFADDVEAGSNEWTATGLWRRASVETGGRPATQAWIYNNGSNYQAATPGQPWQAGDLTSPPLVIPSGAPSFLRFKYYAVVEDGKPYWDQRRVQVVDEQGKVTDLYQLTDDRLETGQIWLQSPPISLAAFAGRTIRIRFHFDAIDAEYNDGAGWMVDDITVDGQGPVAGCEDADRNSPDFATAIAVDSAVTNATICPQGDVDYYRFEGVAGQLISVDIDAQIKGSPLDAQISLLAGDRQSVIAENDDEVLGDKTDPLLTYTLQRSGTYYLKVKAWDAPGVGGTNYTYDLRLMNAPARTPRSIRLIEPTNPKSIPIKPFSIVATAEDYDGGPIAQMEFYWHGPDWVNGDWIKLGVGVKDGNNWYYIVHPALYGDVRGSALYVQAKNAGGAALGTVLWDLEPDAIRPTSRLESLPSELNSTAIPLRWMADDPQNDIVRFEFQYQVNESGAWSDWTNWGYQAPAGARSAWFMGQPGSSYRFRIRAVDASGNVEDYLDVPEATTYLLPGCTADGYEPADNASEGAAALQSGQSQQHNFCQNDVDWFAFDLPAARPGILLVKSLGGGAAFTVNVYNSARAPLATYSSGDLGTSIFRSLSGLGPGTYYLEIRPLVSTLYGTGVSYLVYAGPGSFIHMPVIGR